MFKTLTCDLPRFWRGAPADPDAEGRQEGGPPRGWAGSSVAELSRLTASNIYQEWSLWGAGPRRGSSDRCKTHARRQKDSQHDNAASANAIVRTIKAEEKQKRAVGV